MCPDPKIFPLRGAKVQRKTLFLDVSEQMGQHFFSAFGRNFVVAKQGGLVAKGRVSGLNYHWKYFLVFQGAFGALVFLAGRLRRPSGALRAPAARNHRGFLFFDKDFQGKSRGFVRIPKIQKIQTIIQTSKILWSGKLPKKIFNLWKSRSKVWKNKLHYLT